MGGCFRLFTTPGNIYCCRGVIARRGVIAVVANESCCHIPGIQAVGGVIITSVIAAVASFSPLYPRQAERSMIYIL